MTVTAPLPTQVDAIKALFAELLTADRKQEAVELLDSVLSQLLADHDRLQHQLRLLLKHRFGRKTERLDPAQLQLFLEELRQAVGQADAAPEATPVVAHLRRKRLDPKGQRPVIPDSLPREVVRLEPEEADKTCGCGAEKVCIGCDKSQVLEFIPSQFKVIVYERAKYACKRCEEGVVIAPPPAKPIAGGLPGFGLLADVLVKKYVEHMPLHRMREAYQRAGPNLPVSTLADWVAAGAEALGPIAQEIRRQVLRSYVVQVDDTPLTVLDRGHPGGSKRGAMFAYLGENATVVYDYQETRSSSGPCAFFGLREGWVQADAAGTFEPLFAQGRSKEVGCWSHDRRYYVEALETDKRAAVAIAWIAKLFEVDRQAAGKTPEERLALRRELSHPVYDALGAWVAETRKTATPKSPLGKALTYTVNQWTALGRFLKDGRLELSNNACERALRKVAVGRNNWLFAGSDEGARRAAVIYTVVGTCRLRGVEPWVWVRDVLEKLAGGWKQARIGELLPGATATAAAA